jgi:AGCS family alanine or glycine:cation symporter
MNILPLLKHLNLLIDIPFTFIFLSVSIILTIVTGFPQFCALRRCLRLLCRGIERTESTRLHTIGAFNALFTSMATSIGIGTIVGPSLAIVAGGPGALFWLLTYIFFGSVTKMVEVTFSVYYRSRTKQGDILGGPMQYLAMVHPTLAAWYGFSTMFLFAGWSGIQAKALAEILAHKGVHELFTGCLLAAFVLIVLIGGAKRVSAVASKLVPLMFILYVTFCCWILALHASLLPEVFRLILSSILSPTAPMGGFLGATVFAAIREGTYKGVFITESGMGTASIPHAMSDVEHPIDQGILALFSGVADSFLCFLSGILVLISGIWKTGVFSNALLFTVFESQLPIIGPAFFITCIILFISTTALGNAFNGGQSFAALTKYRWLNWYYLLVALVMVLSSTVQVPLIWALMDLVLPLVALPNLIGLMVLAFTRSDVLRYKATPEYSSIIREQPVQ